MTWPLWGLTVITGSLKVEAGGRRDPARGALSTCPLLPAWRVQGGPRRGLWALRGAGKCQETDSSRLPEETRPRGHPDVGFPTPRTVRRWVCAGEATALAEISPRLWKAVVPVVAKCPGPTAPPSEAGQGPPRSTCTQTEQNRPSSLHHAGPLEPFLSSFLLTPFVFGGLPYLLFPFCSLQ